MDRDRCTNLVVRCIARLQLGRPSRGAAQREAQHAQLEDGHGAHAQPRCDRRLQKRAKETSAGLAPKVDGVRGEGVAG
eukprot:6199034-Pleurochrysis_carterae.AAC.1